MSLADIIIVVIISIILLLIIFFGLVYPRLKGRSGKCASCPVRKDKKIKRAFKEYRKNRK